MNILFVSPYVPSPIRVRPYNFIRALARRGHAITLVCAAGDDDGEALEAMRSVCARVTAVHLSRVDMVRNTIRALPERLPLQAALSCSPQLFEQVRFEASHGAHDVAHIEHLRASVLGSALGSLPQVLDSVDCISLLFERTFRAGTQGRTPLQSSAMALLDLARTRSYEAGYTRRFDRVLVSSPEDAWALEVLRSTQLGTEPNRGKRKTSAVPPIAVVPNGVDLDYFSPQPIARDPATLVFSGKMSFHANVAAALFLVQEIMPLVWAQRPEVRLVIAGSAPARAVQALAHDRRITVTGYLPDLRPAIAHATMAICPLRYGVGIQNKVLEALALATPTIVARQAMRALSARDGQELLLAERADEYATAILGLLTDPARAAQLGHAGRDYVNQKHSWDSAATRLEQLYSQTIALHNAELAQHP